VGRLAWRNRGNSLHCPRRMTSTSLRALLTVVALVAGGQWLRSHLGLTPSIEAIRAFVEALGWQAPAAFVALVSLRQLVLVPAVVLLTAGGIIFGGVLGAALGGTGIIVSGVANFFLARRLGGALLPPWLRAYVLRATARGPAPVLLFTGLATLHPLGPLVAAQWTAGCSTIALSTFLLVVAPASYVRAATLATFGSTLGDFGSPSSLLFAAALVVMVVGPLCSARVRRRLFAPPPLDA
jgi:uncharacterized membrane protein YdjX (TVP38/TMEM64 family)